jgi:xylulokinase
MSLLGIDVGTTGCKAAIFSLDGQLLAAAYEEYDIHHHRPGWAELDTQEVWGKIKTMITRVAEAARSDPVTALSVSSLGEAVVPVTADRRPLAPSILNFDVRGEEYVQALRAALPDHHFYRINGNTIGNNYGLTKIKWIREYQPELYEKTYKFLLWGSFVSFMLGAEPVVDYSLANRTLLFDINQENWSDHLIELADIDRNQLPETVPAGKIIGSISNQIADELGLPRHIAIVSGVHDQNANAVGCGVIEAGQAACTMGTFTCITPVFREHRSESVMMSQGLNTEHHAVPGRFVCFIYNQGGSLVKWFRDTFAALDRHQAETSGADIYAQLLSEMPIEPSRVLVLPHFTVTGPPNFISDSTGVMVGLRLETQRGEILKGIIEGSLYYLRECIDKLPKTGIVIHDYRTVGGGSKSDRWVQICADILEKPFSRPCVTEAGTLGSAIIAGVGSGIFPSFEEGVARMVRLDRTFEPDARRSALYRKHYEKYLLLWPLMHSFLRDLQSL